MPGGDVAELAGVGLDVIELVLVPVVGADQLPAVVDREAEVAVAPVGEGSRDVRGLALEDRRQVRAVEALGRMEAGERHQRRREVDGVGEVVARLAGAAAVGVADHQRHVNQLRVQAVVALPRPVVLAEQDAVIADEADHGRLGEPAIADAVEEAAEPVVDHRHGRLVDDLQPLELCRGEVAGAAVLEVGDLRALVVGVAVHAHVLGRRRPRLVRIEGVDAEEERPVVRGLVELLGGGLEHPCRRGLAGVLAAAVVGEVALDGVDLGLVVAHRRGEPVARLGQRHRRRRTMLAALPEDGDVAVELRAEGLERLGDGQEGVVRHVARPVPRIAHVLDERARARQDRLPAGPLGHPPPRLPVVEREAALAGEDRATRRDRRHRLREDAREARALAGEAVERRRVHLAIAVAADPVRAQAVDHDQDHVALGSRLGGGALLAGLRAPAEALPRRAADRHAGGTGAGGAEQLPAADAVVALAHTLPGGLNR
ncbi:MAG: hypothetical protein WD993_07740 [Thermoleophilaceae bacterium]